MKNYFIFRFAYLSVANSTFYFSGLVGNTADEVFSENMNGRGQLRTLSSKKCHIVTSSEKRHLYDNAQVDSLKRCSIFLSPSKS